jgi:hypothetical protein
VAGSIQHSALGAVLGDAPGPPLGDELGAELGSRAGCTTRRRTRSSAGEVLGATSEPSTARRRAGTAWGSRSGSHWRCTGNGAGDTGPDAGDARSSTGRGARDALGEALSLGDECFTCASPSTVGDRPGRLPTGQSWVQHSGKPELGELGLRPALGAALGEELGEELARAGRSAGSRARAGSTPRGIDCHSGPALERTGSGRLSKLSGRSSTRSSTGRSARSSTRGHYRSSARS